MPSCTIVGCCVGQERCRTAGRRDHDRASFSCRRRGHLAGLPLAGWRPQLHDGGRWFAALLGEGIGDGTTTDWLSPTSVAPFENGGIGIVGAGLLHMCISLSVSGQLECWGKNNYGQLGDGTTTDRLSPTVVKNISNVDRVAGGIYFTCARIRGGSVACWGDNTNGQLGDGTYTQHLTPTMGARSWDKRPCEAARRCASGPHQALTGKFPDLRGQSGALGSRYRGSLGPFRATAPSGGHTCAPATARSMRVEQLRLHGLAEPSADDGGILQKARRASCAAACRSASCTTAMGAWSWIPTCRSSRASACCSTPSPAQEPSTRRSSTSGSKASFPRTGHVRLAQGRAHLGSVESRPGIQRAAQPVVRRRIRLWPCALAQATRRAQSSRAPAESEWQVLIRDAHPAYISWQEYERIAERLDASAQKTQFASHGRSPPREGSALLQGRAVCGLCGSRMHVHYNVRRNGAHRQLRVLRPRSGLRRSAVPEHARHRSRRRRSAGSRGRTVTPMAIQLALAIQQEIQRASMRPIACAAARSNAPSTRPTAPATATCRSSRQPACRRARSKPTGTRSCALSRGASRTTSASARPISSLSTTRSANASSTSPPTSPPSGPTRKPRTGAQAHARACHRGCHPDQAARDHRRRPLPRRRHHHLDSAPPTDRSADPRDARQTCAGEIDRLLDEYTDARVALFSTSAGSATGTGDAIQSDESPVGPLLREAQSLKERLLDAGMLTSKQMSGELGVSRTDHRQLAPTRVASRRASATTPASGYTGRQSSRPPVKPVVVRRDSHVHCMRCIMKSDPSASRSSSAAGAAAD